MTDPLFRPIEELIYKHLSALPIRFEEYNAVRDTVTALAECERLTAYLQEDQHWLPGSRQAKAADLLTEIRVCVAIGAPKGASIERLMKGADILREVDRLIERRLGGKFVQSDEWKTALEKLRHYRQQYPLNQFIDRDLQASRLYLTGSGVQVIMSAQSVLDKVIDEINDE